MDTDLSEAGPTGDLLETCTPIRYSQVAIDKQDLKEPPMKKLLLLLIVVGIIVVVVMNQPKSDTTAKNAADQGDQPKKEKLRVEEKYGIAGPDVNLP